MAFSGASWEQRSAAAALLQGSPNRTSLYSFFAFHVSANAFHTLLGKTVLQIDLANTYQGHNNMGDRAKREDGSTSSQEIMPETAQPTSNWHGAYFAPSSPSTAISSSPLLLGFCPAYVKLALQSRKDVVYQAELPISSTSTTHRSSHLQSALAARGGSKDSQSE